MCSTNLIGQLKYLLSNGYLIEHVLKEGGKVVKYGSPATLLRRNIQSEWWDDIVVNQSNVFPVENSMMCETEEDTSCWQQSSDVNDDSVFLRNKFRDDMLHHYLPTLNHLMNNRLPFSLVQISKHDNTGTSSDKQHNVLLNRSVENTNLVLQYYTAPSTMFQAFDQLVVNRLRWWKKFFRNPDNLSTIDIKYTDNEITSTGIQYKCPWGNETLETICNHGGSPLQKLESITGMNCKGKWMRKTLLPHILELETSLENSTTAILVDSYKEKNIFSASKTTKSQQPRWVLQLHPHLAPFKVAIATTGNKLKEIRHVGDHIVQDLRKHGLMIFDVTDANGQDSQFKRYDELGIPYTIIINDQTLDTGVAGLRNRDTTLKEQLHVTNVTQTVLKYLKPI